MNRVFANVLSFLNVLVGLIIILLGVFWGRAASEAADVPAIVGLVGGGVAGVVAAAMLCGVLALFVLIERHLRVIAGTEQPRPPKEKLQPAREEPRM